LTSILRVSALLRDRVAISALSLVMLAFLPHGVVEGYGIFRAIDTTLRSSLTMRRLTMIYLIFLLAAVLEVGFVQASMAR